MIPFFEIMDIDDDKKDFQKLYDANNKNMFAIAKSILKSNALAEEAVQQTWLNIINNFDKINQIPKNSVRAYIMTSVKNVSLNIYKKENYCEPMENEFILDKITMNTKSNDNSDQFEFLVEIIRTMPEKYRQILELKFVMEWSNDEIAKFLNMNVSTVSTRIQRGRKMLIKTLKSKGIDQDNH